MSKFKFLTEEKKKKKNNWPDKTRRSTLRRKNIERNGHTACSVFH